MAEYRSGRPRTSSAWDHFEIKDPELCTATCNHCQDIFSYKATVSNLLKHLNNKHNFKDGEDVFASDTGDDEKSNKGKCRRSKVWEYFEVKDDESKLAICNLCSEQFSYRSTSANLGMHLKRTHGIEVGKAEEDEDMEVEKLETDEEEDEKVETTFNEGNGRRLSSAAWDHFTIINHRKKVAACNLCSAACSYRTSTSNLMKHVRRKHGIDLKQSLNTDTEDEDESDADVKNTGRKPEIMRSNRSIVWLYYKCVDPDSKLSQCLICKKLLSHSSTLTNLKKHLARKHPNAKIPDRRPDGTKRIFLSSGGELYEVEADVKNDIHAIDEENQNDTLEMDTIYLDDFDATAQEPAEKKPTNTAPRNRKRKRASKTYKELVNTSSDEEVTLLNKYAKKQCNSLDYFGRYVASLLKQLPKQISNQLQTDFVKQIMHAQLTYETQKAQVTDTESNAYSITITAEHAEQNPKRDVLENVDGSNVVNEFVLEN